MSEMTLLDGVRTALWEEMERDDSVVLMGEDVEQRRSFIQRNAKDVRFLDI